MLWVAAMWLLYWNMFYVETVECMSWVCMVIWNKILLLLNMDCLLCRRLWSEYSVHFVGGKKLSACREFLVVHTVGKMAQDIRMV